MAEIRKWTLPYAGSVGQSNAAVRDMTRVWGGRTVADRTAERRTSVLQAAIDIVGEHGARAMTTKAVSARAGVAPRRIYESFDSRDTLLLGVFDACLARASEQLVAAFNADPDAAIMDRLHTVLAAAADAAEKDPAMVRILFIEAVSDPVLGERSQMLQGVLEALVAQQASDAGVDDIIDRATATFIIGGGISAYTAWLSGRLDMTRDEVVEFAVHKVGRLLGLDPAGG